MGIKKIMKISGAVLVIIGWTAGEIIIENKLHEKLVGFLVDPLFEWVKS